MSDLDKTMPIMPADNYAMGKTTPIINAVPVTPRYNVGITIHFTYVGKSSYTDSFEVMLNDVLVIGRESSSEKLSFKNDELMSKRHCELRYYNKGVYIRDLGSTNGTYVNGVAINGSYRLETDDRIQIGSYEFRIGF